MSLPRLFAAVVFSVGLWILVWIVAERVLFS